MVKVNKCPQKDCFSTELKRKLELSNLAKQILILGRN